MSKTTFALAAAAGAMLLSGCVSTKNIKADAAALRTGAAATVTVSQREKPSFSAMTAGKAGFGLIGAAAMIAAGNDIIRKNEVDDPANYIAAELAAQMAASLGAQVVPNAGVTTKASNARELAKAYPAADLLLDVQTINWSFVYFPTDWNNYRVVYSAKLRLVDTRSGAMKAEGFCARVPEKTADAPSRDQLLDDNAAGLKRELRIAADHCIGELRDKVLGV